MNNFFIQPYETSLLIYGTYTPWLVFLSFAIAIFTSTMALQVAKMASVINGRWQRQLAVISGAIALGGGTWAMHFIGMLAFDLCTFVTYDRHQTLLSMLPSLGASWVAMDLMARPKINRTQWILGGVLVGSGIGAMHYSGMAALEMSPTLRYDPIWFGVSLIVAVSFAMLALKIRFGIRGLVGKRKEWQILLISGTVMGFAIACMHYTGMMAARFVAPSGFTPQTDHPEADWMALMITLVTLMLTILVSAGGTAIVRYRQLFWKMRASESRLQAIVDTAANGLVMLDEHGLIKSFNPAAETMFGWNASEVIDQQVDVLVHPDHRTAFHEYLAHTQTPNSEFLGKEFDIEGIHRSGNPLPFRISLGRAILGANSVFVGFLTDRRERLEMEQALKDSEQQSRSLMSNTPGMVFRRLLTERWPLVVMSGGSLGVTGYTSQEFMSGEVCFRNLIEPEDLLRVEPLMQKCMNERTPYASEFRIRHKDGSRRWVMSRGRVVLDEDGHPRFFDGLIMDITERRTMEDALVAAKDKAELAAASKSAFLANMSHEIRTPMNAIIGFTEFLMGTELAPLQRRHLGTVRQSARSLLLLLNDILDTAKLEKGAIEIESADFSLETLAHQVVESQRLTAEGKGLLLELDYSQDMGRFFKGDPLRIQQILSNLVGNAVKFTSEGFVKLQVFEDGSQVHMVVHDSGIGIAADRIEKIFDPFAQADASMSRRYGGTGLGTTIARQLVDLMHGKLWVNSTLGVGSSFHVVLPLAMGNAVQDAPERLHLALDSLNILVVDDVSQNLELLSLILGKAGHNVITASDGMEAIEAWETKALDVILMDVQMPVMDGLEATKRIRQLEQDRGLPEIPIIALTASVLEKNRAETSESGMNGFATKPIELAELISEIARVLGIAVEGDEPEASPEATEAPSAVPVDWERGLELWGSTHAQEQAIRRLMTENQDVVWEMRRLIEKGELEEARQIAHMLRGTAGNLCLMAIHHLAADMEHALRAEDGQAVLAVLPTLEANIAEVWSALSLMVDSAVRTDISDYSSDIPAPEIDSEEFRDMAQAMIASMRRGEMEESILSPVIHALRADSQSEVAQEIEDAFNGFEFQRAENLLESLMETSTATV